MNGPQHYAEAEYQLAKLDEKSMHFEEIQARMARAQVHATLALVAATVDANSLVPGDPMENVWLEAVQES